jgi:cytochrome c
MRMNIWLCFVIAVVATSHALAADGVAPVLVSSESDWVELATKRNCILCHEKRADALGPNLKDIAAEYAGNDDAEGILLRKVYEGGVGKWGTTAMPSQCPPASPEEIKALVRYMLSYK